MCSKKKKKKKKIIKVNEQRVGNSCLRITYQINCLVQTARHCRRTFKRETVFCRQQRVTNFKFKHMRNIIALCDIIIETNKQTNNFSQRAESLVSFQRSQSAPGQWVGSRACCSSKPPSTHMVNVHLFSWPSLLLYAVAFST